MRIWEFINRYRQDINGNAAIIGIGITDLFCLQKTFHGVVYNRSFNFYTYIYINGYSFYYTAHNLKSDTFLGMVGALSIVRFRTAVKEPIDIAYLFWAIAVGITTGAGFYSLSLLGSLFISAVIVAFSFIPETMQIFIYWF